MKSMKTIRQALLFIFALGAFIIPVSFKAGATPLSSIKAARQPDIGVKGYYAMEKAQRGRAISAAIVMEIPKGYHVNANRTLSKFLVPTTLKIDDVGDGVKVGGISYPRALVRDFSFSKDKLAVYEGRAVMRFNVTIPANFPHSKMLLRARVKYQSCSDEVCYAPASRDVTMWIDIAGDKETPKRANGNIFGKKG
jgi:hypothetical protein